MRHFPSRFPLSSALAADVAAVVVAVWASLFAPGRSRAATVAAAVGLALVALVRFGARVPIAFAVDEVGKVMTIGARTVALTDVSVGPRSPDGRSFRLYELGDRVRTHEVHVAEVGGAVELHGLIERLGAKVTVAHSERHDLAVLIRRLVPALLGLCGISFAVDGLDYDGGEPFPIVLFGGLSLVFALIDAAGVRSPPLIIDGVRRRVYWRGWHGLADVRIEPPRISNLSTPDLVVSLSGQRLRLGLAWMPTAPIKAALLALPGVVQPRI